MFLCIENGEVVSLLPYKPNVPVHITVIELSEEDSKKLVEQTHYFDTKELLVKEHSADNKHARLKASEQAKQFLQSTDWMVLRHVREQALGLATSMSEDQYIQLEKQRQEASEKIVSE